MEQSNNEYNNPFKYNGKELDEATGLYYYGARYYDPKTSIWLSVDPLAVYNPVTETEFYGDGQHNGGVYNSRNLNPYIYTYQNPINYVDPNGKQNYFNSKIDANGKRYFEFTSQGANMQYGSVVNVYDNNNKYVVKSYVGASAPGKTVEAYGKHYLKETEHISAWDATKEVARRTWASEETQPVLLAPLSAVLEMYAVGSTLTNIPRIKDIKEFKSLVRMISKADSELNINALKKFEKIVEKFGGKLRYDLEPVKGGWKPHVQVEGLGQKIESRHIQLSEDAVKILKNGGK
ncbi:RHS repeat-associated core domain-containing protein [Kaistella sp. DKR-2]|uniref:RHS repeat-associated core domain-containing protein n=1 Tax=Kaistella soli TaxID=2849654 RepID=UPI001C25AA77|nr:RHS repeat-associated core domain-containing protein [Kaistella soli]MBU8884067.1 RHS repeat-associated core domain-containing protein [Kaistella soli]